MREFCLDLPFHWIPGGFLRDCGGTESSVYDDRWIPSYISEKMGQKVMPGDVRKNDFSLKKGEKIRWRSYGWMVVK